MLANPRAVVIMLQKLTSTMPAALEQRQKLAQFEFGQGRHRESSRDMADDSDTRSPRAPSRTTSTMPSATLINGQAPGPEVFQGAKEDEKTNAEGQGDGVSLSQAGNGPAMVRKNPASGD